MTKLLSPLPDHAEIIDRLDALIDTTDRLDNMHVLAFSLRMFRVTLRQYRDNPSESRLNAVHIELLNLEDTLRDEDVPEWLQTLVEEITSRYRFASLPVETACWGR